MNENPSINTSSSVNVPLVSDGIGFPVTAESVDEIKSTYWPLIRAKGYYVLVKPYTRPEMVGSIILTDSARAEDPFQTQVGQVIDIGPLAYSNRELTGGLIWCKIGDWVVFPRIAGSLLFKKSADGKGSIPFRRIKDDDVDDVISNPEDWIMGIPKQF